MLFRMMTYIEKYHFARVEIYHEKLFHHHKAILKGDYKAEKNVTSKCGREMLWLVAKDNIAVDKEITLVDN